MSQTKFYLVLLAIGTAAPWLFLAKFLGDNQASIPYFFASIFTNHVSSAVATDLIISSLAFFTLVFFEGRRAGLRHLWLYVPATLCIGLSFGLPLFLYMRARTIELR